MAKKQTKKPVAAEIPDLNVTPEDAVAAEEAQQLANAPDYDLPDAGRLVEVWERRFTNPGERPSEVIQLKAPGLVTRWINTSIEGRYHRAVYDQGWQPVPVKLLKDRNSIPDLYKHPHGITCRGERGKEVLMMMPKEVFERIQQRKTEITNRSLKNIRSEMANAAAQKYGAEAGEFVESGVSRDGMIKQVGSISFGQERVTPEGA